MSIKPLLLATCLLACASISQAQTTPPSITTQTREMAERLKLNEAQYIRLLSINRTRLARQQEIERATASNAPARSVQLAELQSQYEQECGRILSPTQLSQLQQDTAQPQPQPTGIANGNG